MKWLKGNSFPVISCIILPILLASCVTRTAEVEEQQSVTLRHMNSANIYAAGTWFFDDTIYNSQVYVAHQHDPVNVQVRHASSRWQHKTQMESQDSTSKVNVQLKQSQSRVSVSASRNQYHLTPVTTLLVLGFIAIFILVLFRLHRKTLGYR